MTQEHLDADVVAAWAEGSLDPHARAAAEAHAADCARCQAVLAAMIRTDPVAAEPSRGWLAGHIRWFVPLATAAAAVALWVGLSRDLPAPSPTETAPQAAVERDAIAPPGPAAPAQPLTASKRQVEPGPGARQPAAVLHAEPPVQKQPEETREKPAAAPPQPGALQTKRAADTELRAVTESVGLSQQSAVIFRAFASPDLATQWRVGPGGAIHRSSDAGKTWIAQKSGVTLDLFAASAPSNAVCWVVGRSGVVLLTTGGATWRRVPFPEPADLRTVVATDARTATVTTLDGRVFRTFDGGVNWQR